MAMIGQPALPSVLAEAEVPVLRRDGARVFRDLTGRPCCRLDDPAVIAGWPG
jgi:hypothetical protein